MQKWFGWLRKIKKTDEVKTIEEEHREQVGHMAECADGSAGLLNIITKPTGVERRSEDPGEGRII